MKSDLTCPVEILNVQVEQQENEGGKQIVCLIDFFNLSLKTIDSLQMNIICFDGDGVRLGGRLVRAAVTAGGRTEFSGSFAPEHVDGAVRVEAAVEKVWYQDGVVWRREERNVREYTPNALPKGRELDRLRAVAGEDAAGYAREDDIVWMCVCGRANRTSDDKCLRCERERAQVMRDYCYEAIEATAGQKERARQQQTEKNLRRSSAETAHVLNEKRVKQNKRRRRLRVVIILLVIVALILAGLRWGVPYAAVLYADYKLGSGMAADARSVYLWVDQVYPGYGAAAQKADDAEIIIIEGLIAYRQADTLDEAARRAKALGEKGDALYHQAMMERAALAAQSGDTEMAETIYRSLGSAAQDELNALVYSIASEAQKNVNYPVAIERYASLGDYQDAAAQHEECIYDYGRQLMREGEYALASEQFLLVTGRPDAIALIRECRYEQANQEMAAAEYVAAAALYESLGVYEEAETRARYCRYTAGMALLAEEDYAGAAEQLGLAGDYEDAQERFNETVYMLGCAALDAGSYAEAIRWLEQLEREGDALDAYNRAVYGYAVQLEEAGEKERASTEYARVGDYEDARDRRRALEYALAVESMETAPEAALARFEELGSYQDAKERAQECRYMLALQAESAGNYELALERFLALEDYQDCESRARSSRYALAGQLYAEDEYEASALMYEECGAYLDAEDRAMRARYALAEAYEAAADYQAAAGAFDALGSYEDAKLRTAKNEIAWLGEPYKNARMDLEVGDYDNVIAALEPYIGLDLPARYSNIPTMYEKACLEGGRALIKSGRALDALVLLERIPHNKQAKTLLDEYVFRIIGRWKTKAGVEYIFRRDGTCRIAGEEKYFGGSKYEIFIGDEPYPDEAGFNVINLSGKTLTIKDNATGKNVRMTYVGEPTPKPEPEPEAAAPGEATPGEAQPEGND